MLSQLLQCSSENCDDYGSIFSALPVGSIWRQGLTCFIWKQEIKQNVDPINKNSNNNNQTKTMTTRNKSTIVSFAQPFFWSSESVGSVWQHPLVMCSSTEQNPMTSSSQLRFLMGFNRVVAMLLPMQEPSAVSYNLSICGQPKAMQLVQREVWDCDEGCRRVRSLMFGLQHVLS